MNTPLRLSQEPVSPAIEAAAAHAEDISNAFRDLQIVLPPETIVRRDEPLARRTTLRVGGPADLYIEPSSDNALASTLEIAHLRHSFVSAGPWFQPIGPRWRYPRDCAFSVPPPLLAHRTGR